MTTVDGTTKGQGETSNLKNQLTFYEVSQSWLAKRKSRIKKSSYIRYGYALDKQIVPALGCFLIREITAEHFEEFSETKLLAGRLDGTGGLAPQTVTGFLIIIKSIMRYAEREGYSGEVPSIEYPSSYNKEIRVLSKWEQKKLERILHRNMDLPALGVMLSLYSGLRLGEVCALKWKDICLPDRTLKVHKTIQRIKNTEGGKTRTKVIIDKPKSKKSIRDIPLPKFMAELLREYIGNDENYILSGMPFQALDMRTIQYRFKYYLTKANIVDANFHSLRHTFATRCVEADVDIKTLSEMLGHSSVKITMDLYVHPTMDQKRRCVDKLAKFMSVS